MPPRAKKPLPPAPTGTPTTTRPEPGTVVVHQVRPPEVAPVPTDPKSAPNERHFRIAHTMVGPYEKDRIVSESDLKELLGDEKDHDKHLVRLLKTGAMVQTNLDLTTTPLPPGPYNTGADSGSEAPLLSTNSQPGDIPSDLVTPPGDTDKALLEGEGDEDDDTDEDEDDEDDEDEDEDEEDDGEEGHDEQGGGSHALPGVPKPPVVR